MGGQTKARSSGWAGWFSVPASGAATGCPVPGFRITGTTKPSARTGLRGCEHRISAATKVLWQFEGASSTRRVPRYVAPRSLPLDGRQPNWLRQAGRGYGKGWLALAVRSFAAGPARGRDEFNRPYRAWEASGGVAL